MSASAADDGLQRKERKPDDELDITPMIDVTFLLLIFFMVTSTMKPKPDVELPEIRHYNDASASQSLIVTVTLKNGKPAFFHGPGKGTPIPFENLRELAREEIEINKKQFVILKVDKEASHGLYSKVAREFEDYNDLIVFKTGVEEER